MRQSPTTSRFQFGLLKKTVAKSATRVLYTWEMQLDTPNRESFKLAWLDLLWIIFLGALAVLPPFFEFHKQLALLAIGTFQIFEQRLLKSINPRRAGAYSVLIKVLLATILVGHTGEIPINSSYYLIYYLPVVSAAMTFGPWGTLLWTALASVAYCSYLIDALDKYILTPSGAAELAIRNLFFFLAALVVNRVVTEHRRQVSRYQSLAATLAETNHRLEQVQAEARRSERLAALGQLSAGLAHEIRNPLGVIKGSAETLNRKLRADDPLIGELTGFISAEVSRLNALVSRFLDFARPLQLQTHPQDILPILEQALKAVHDRWPEARIEVEREYSPNLPKAVVDEELCQQVFTNLILNAYEAMPEGGKLKVAASAANADSRRGIEIRISDSGPGVPIELREQVFNPFFTTKKNGVGLGLSLVSKIVDDHQGWLRVENQLNGGACFRTFLPAEESSDEIP
jgi:two-component system, NtrC family, sensor histidine kinase HydH